MTNFRSLSFYLIEKIVLKLYSSGDEFREVPVNILAIQKMLSNLLSILDHHITYRPDQLFASMFIFGVVSPADDNKAIWSYAIQLSA